MSLSLSSFVIKSIRIFLTYFLFLGVFCKSNSQNVIIRGKSHVSYSGKIIELFLTSDYITNSLQRETNDTIDSDGYFELHLQSDYVQPAILKIGNATAQLYVRPDFVYGITFPAIDEKKDYHNDTELNVNIGIIGTDSTELNALIFDYQEQYNKIFISDNDRYISRAIMFKYADSLQRICDKRYAKIKDPYFRNYITYSIASINASVSRGENYLINGHILRKPIQYNHKEYMSFFDACFKGYLNSVATQHKGQSLYNIINVKASYDQLWNFLNQDKFLKNDTLRELVIIKNLWDCYFSPDFVPDAVETIISQINQNPKTNEHKRITAIMLAYMNKMVVGSEAPDFSARTRDGKIESLSNFKGRWIYLNFFSTQNLESLKEMPQIASLKKTYGDKITFLSICLDDSLKSYLNYFKVNPKYDWPIWYNNGKSLTKTAKQSYFVSGSEAYFLISNTGYLAQSPALAPSKGIDHRFKLLFKVRKKNTKTGIR